MIMCGRCLLVCEGGVVGVVGLWRLHKVVKEFSLMVV